MIESAQELGAALSESLGKLTALSESDVMQDRGAGKWVKKEILGHLIDSAVNNHQRFVRAQIVDPLLWPGYDQDAWVAVQNYKHRSWVHLVELWEQLNRHLAHVMASVPPSKLATPCVVGQNEAVTLEWLMNDYVKHLRHHLGQILAS